MKNQTQTQSVTRNTQLPWDTLHVFGYGECQLIGNNLNKKVDNTNLTSQITPIVNQLASLQQAGTTISMTTVLALNIFNGSYIVFLPNSSDNLPQRFTWDSIDPTLIENLVSQINPS